MKHKRLVKWIKHHKKLAIISTVFILVVSMAWWMVVITKSDQAVTRTDANALVETEAKLELVPSPLTGLMVTQDKASRPITAIVIENLPEVRPQSSLDEAGLVFEAIAEGGITRFIAFYQETRPDPIGPVRSLRPYFNDWVRPFDASIAHVGGSAIALNEVKRYKMKDLDQFANGDSYYRTTDRYAPHNVYTNFKLLDALNKKKGYKTSNFEPLPRKDEAPAETVKARVITVEISSFSFEVSYKYHGASNSYRRSMAGEPHKDRESGKYISPKVVVVMNVPNSINYTTDRYVYDLTGTGKVTIFQDGEVIKGKWRKSSRSDMIEFVTNGGETIELNRGQVWITAIDPGKKPRYSL